VRPRVGRRAERVAGVGEREARVVQEVEQFPGLRRLRLGGQQPLSLLDPEHGDRLPDEAAVAAFSISDT
jgi:hypothetical protein